MARSKLVTTDYWAIGFFVLWQLLRINYLVQLEPPYGWIVQYSLLIFGMMALRSLYLWKLSRFWYVMAFFLIFHLAFLFFTRPWWSRMWTEQFFDPSLIYILALGLSMWYVIQYHVVE